jgi:hypothetical protein
MTNTIDPFSLYFKNIYSQNGEDGVVEELFRRLKIESGWVCEFGAWDGQHLSNTFRLIKKGFKGVFIEGDKEKYRDLEKTVEKEPNIIPICAFVNPELNHPDCLDNLLAKTSIPKYFDLLSIDVDSCDYHIWKGLKNYRPVVVIIEINSSADPRDPNFIHGGQYSGSGFQSTLNLGKEKKYTLVTHTGNMIFIADEYLDDIKLSKEAIVNPHALFKSYWR